MTNVVNTRIKAFGKSPKVNFVSPSEQLITLTIGQLQELVAQGIAAYYIRNAVEIADVIYSAMETFDEAVTLLPDRGACLRSSLRDALLTDGGDPVQGIRIIEAHVRKAVEALQ
jgi:hypothetical protein